MVPQTPPPTPSGATTYGGATTTTTTTRDGSSKGLVVSLMDSLRALWKRKKSQDTQNKKPKKFLSKISRKLISFKNKKNVLEEKKEEVKEQEEDFGDGGLWQKEILMGDKCQPLDFSGVIYYDRNGRRLPELPMKSPRASPLPSYLYASSKSADQLKIIKENK